MKRSSISLGDESIMEHSSRFLPWDSTSLPCANFNWRKRWRHEVEWLRNCVIKRMRDSNIPEQQSKVDPLEWECPVGRVFARYQANVGERDENPDTSSRQPCKSARLYALKGFVIENVVPQFLQVWYSSQKHNAVRPIPIEHFKALSMLYFFKKLDTFNKLVKITKAL